MRVTIYVFAFGKVAELVDAPNNFGFPVIKGILPRMRMQVRVLPLPQHLNQKEMEETKFITVTITLSEKTRPVNNKWHVKMERDIIHEITVPAFSFMSESMNVAVTKVADLVARHPENYFSKIEIK